MWALHHDDNPLPSMTPLTNFRSGSFASTSTPKPRPPPPASITSSTSPTSPTSSTSSTSKASARPTMRGVKAKLGRFRTAVLELYSDDIPARTRCQPLARMVPTLHYSDYPAPSPYAHPVIGDDQTALLLPASEPEDSPPPYSYT